MDSDTNNPKTPTQEIEEMFQKTIANLTKTAENLQSASKNMQSAKNTLNDIPRIKKQTNDRIKHFKAKQDIKKKVNTFTSTLPPKQPVKKPKDSLIVELDGEILIQDY